MNPIEELLAKQAVGFRCGDDAEFTFRHSSKDGLKSCEVIFGSQSFDNEFFKNTFSTEDSKSPDVFVGNQPSDVRSTQVWNAQNDEHVRQGVLLLPLQSVVDFVGGQRETIPRLQSDVIFRGPEQRSMKLDIETTDWIAAAIEKPVVRVRS